jgi:hypothetical protein
MTREQRERVAKALMSYKSELREEMKEFTEDSPDYEYNCEELEATDEMAKALDLVGDYYTLESEYTPDALNVAIAELVASADDTGCTNDLTVVSKDALERLKRVVGR